MNLGSHTPAQIAKLLPDLDAQYKRAQEELLVAQQNVHEARVRVQEAEKLLTEALSRFLRTYPEHVLAAACQPTSLMLADGEPVPSPQVAGDNGSGMVAER